MPTVAPYGSWVSPVTAELVTGSEVGLGQPALDGADVYWLEARPEEGGRSVLVRRAADGTTADLTPAPFNVRTRVHEYGGGAYAVAGGVVVAVNFADQRLYRLRPGAEPEPLPPESDRRQRSADLALDLPRGRVLAVREDHRAGGREPENTLVEVPLGGRDDPGTVVAAGHDFFSSPRLSHDGRRLAWLTWDHPNMPWDGTSLWVGEVGSEGAPVDVRRVAGGPEESIVQPEWSPDGTLHFASDRTGWWNLYRLRDGGEAVPLCPMAAEFAGPAWVFGLFWYAFLGPDDVLCCFGQNGTWRLGRLDAAAGRLTPYDPPYTEFGGVRAADRRAVMLVGAPDRPSAVAALDPATGAVTELRRAAELAVDPAYLSRPESLTFPTDDGDAHAFYYPPTNPEFEAPPGERPPLIVKSHGGPTGSASGALRLAAQFWTSRGFALVDVNYGGSTGFGRAYRERLQGRWGEVDVRDCARAAEHLVALGKADGDRLAITGGSAGGYTTLCALAFTDTFRAGASHYGVSDLEALARDTHKFESRYLDRLVGPYPEAKATYEARSPLRHAGRLSCPVIFFQGLEDAVVPPNQAEMMVEALRRKGVPVAYLTF
ncbi:MAG TPA: prolyl oligopeptidase family serine peptidase, partial [Geminicoccaceae bacterium]|nr:prolyl oligopeptidase family serine peptidase [Geminicoccaceae bacterium]